MERLPNSESPASPCLGYNGLTKREYFAGQIAASTDRTEWQTAAQWADYVVAYADALLAKLAESEAQK